MTIQFEPKGPRTDLDYVLGMSPRWLIRSLFVLVVLAAACANDSGDDVALPDDVAGPSSTEVAESIESEQTPTSDSTESPNTEEEIATESPTTEEEATTEAPTEEDAGLPAGGGDPPPGVAEQFEWFNVGNGVCTEFFDADAPLVATSPFTEAPILTSLNVCLVGYDPDQPSIVQITDPTGNEQMFEVPTETQSGVVTVYDGIPYLGFDVELYTQTGRYLVTAEQGPLSSSTSFDIIQPRRPVLHVQPASGAPGDVFTLQLAGLPPTTGAQIDLYFATDSANFVYTASFEGPPSDDVGRVEIPLSTALDDQQGTYCLVLRTNSRNPSCVRNTFSLFE